MLVSSGHSFLTSGEAAVLTPASQRSVFLQFASNASSSFFLPIGGFVRECGSFSLVQEWKGS